MQKWTLESSLHPAKGMLPSPCPMLTSLCSIARVPSWWLWELDGNRSSCVDLQNIHREAGTHISFCRGSSLSSSVFNTCHLLASPLHTKNPDRWTQTDEKQMLKITSKRRSGSSQPNAPLSQFSSCTNSFTDTAERVEWRQEQVATACLSRYYLWKMHVKSCLISSDRQEFVEASKQDPA